MSLSGFLPAVSRRAIVITGAAAVLMATTGMVLKAQDPAAPQTPAAPAAQAPPDPLTFPSADPRVVFISLTPDAAQAFEAALGKAKEALVKSTKPEQKDQCAHWKVLKGGPQQDGTIPFLFILDKTVSGASYNPFVILKDAGLAAEEYTNTITPLFTKVNAGFKGFVAITGAWTDMVGAPAGGTK
jgi:hypothetical protein